MWENNSTIGVDIAFIYEKDYHIPPIKPETAAPMWKSTSKIFSTDDGSNRVDVRRFSTAKMIPLLVWIPTAVEPSFTASMAYST